MIAVSYRRFFSASLFVAMVVGLESANAQYPKEPEDVRRQAAQKMIDSDRRSDEAWQTALPVVREWEAKGKPYIPWARVPEELPQIKRALELGIDR